jgi:hypothetical protein
VVFLPFSIVEAIERNRRRTEKRKGTWEPKKYFPRKKENPKKFGEAQ